MMNPQLPMIGESGLITSKYIPLADVFRLYTAQELLLVLDTILNQ